MTAFVSGTRDRLIDRCHACGDTSTELIRTAWVYLGVEDENTGKFDGNGTIKEDEAAETFSESSPKLPKLTIKNAEINDLSR